MKKEYLIPLAIIIGAIIIAVTLFYNDDQRQKIKLCEELYPPNMDNNTTRSPGLENSYRGCLMDITRN